MMENIYKIIDVLNNENIIICARTILAIICGGVIGLERGRSNQPAGMRTYMLVCLGSALIMLTSEYMYIHFNAGDPARLGAQVINGIGFLGAGSIIISGKTKVKGLTTAAGLWVSACIGIAIGIGFYLGGIISTVFVYMIMTKFRKLEDRLISNHTCIKIYIEFKEFAVIPAVKEAVDAIGLELADLQITSNKDNCNAIIEMKESRQKKSDDIITYLEHVEGIEKIRYVT